MQVFLKNKLIVSLGLATVALFIFLSPIFYFFYSKILLNEQILQHEESVFAVILIINAISFSILFGYMVLILIDSKSKTFHLNKSNDLLQTVLRNTYHMVVATDIRGVVTLFNQAAERELGYTAQEVVGKKNPQIWHDPQEVLSKLEAYSKEYGVPIMTGFDVFVAKARRGILNREEWTYIRKDGSRFPGLLTFTTLREEGAVTGYLAVVENLSSQKKILHENKDLRRAMELAIDGIAILDTEGRYLFVNDAYASMTGYRVQELLNQAWEITVHPDDRQRMLEEYQTMLTTGHVAAEARGLRKDGSIFDKYLTMISHFDEQGTFIGHYCFMQDISYRKEVERKIGVLASIVSFSEEAILSKDLNGMILSWNSGVELLFGYHESEALGQSIAMIYPKNRYTQRQ